MATETSKRIVEVVLKVVDRAGKGIQQASASLRQLSVEEEKASASAKKHGKAQAESAKGTSEAGDAASKTSKKVQTLGKNSQTASKKTAKIGTAANKAKKGVKKLGDEAQKTGKKVTKMGDDMMGSVGTMMNDFGTLVASVAAVALPVVSFAGFERSMAEVGAVANATEGELKRLTDRAMELGSTTEFTAGQVAQGMKFLSMAGLSVEQTYESIDSVLDLALAGSLELGAAADIATNILTGFGMSASELSGVNDVLVTAFTNTNSTLGELGFALAYVGPIAAGLGADFNDLVSALGLLHNAGLKGSMAGTALRSVLDTLFNPTKDEADQLSVLSDRIGGVGLQVSNVNGDFVGFASLIAQLEVSGITAAEALSLFGQRAGPGMAALLNQGSSALEDMTDKLDDSDGRARELAVKMGENLTGAFRELSSAVEGFMIRVGSKLAPTIEKITISITKTVDAVNILVEANPKLASSVIKVTGSILGLVAALKVLKLLSMTAGFLTPTVFKTAGGAAGTSFMSSFAAKATTGAKKHLPTFVGVFSKVGTLFTGLLGSIGGSISTWVASYATTLTGSVSAVFGGAGTAGAAAFLSMIGGALAAGFAGFKFGEWIEPWVSKIELLFTNLNISESLQVAFAKVDNVLNHTTAFFSNFFQEVFWNIPRLFLAKMTTHFASWIKGLVSLGKKFPGLGKLLGWGYDKTGITAALDAIIDKSSQMTAQVNNDRKQLYSSAEQQKQINQSVVDSIHSEANARQAAFNEEKVIAAKKAAMYEAIEAVNKEFDPNLEKAQKELGKIEKQFFQLQATARSTADGIRSSLVAAGEGINKKITAAFDGVDGSAIVEKLGNTLGDLNRDYLRTSKDLSKEIRKIENEIGDARVSATVGALDESLGLIKEQAGRRIALEKAAASKIATTAQGQKREEEALQQAITKISQEGALAKKQAYTRASQEIQKEIDRSISKEEELANKLLSLVGILKGAVDSINSDQRDIERELMSPAEAYRDQLKEVKEVLSEGDRLLAAGKMEEAVAKWRESASLAKATAKEIKSGDDLLVSKTQASRRALADMEAAENRIEKSGGKAVAAVTEQLQAQQQHTDTVKDSLNSINTELTALEKLTQEGLKVEIAIDLKGFDREMAKLTTTQTSILEVAVQYDEAQEKRNQIQLEKTEAYQTRVVDAYGDMATGVKEYHAAIASNGSADTETGKEAAASIQEVKNGYQELIVATSETGKQFITTAASMSTGFSAFGKVVKTEPLAAVKELKTAIGEVGDVPIKPKIETNSQEIVNEIETIYQALSEESDKVVDIDLPLPKEIDVIVNIEGEEGVESLKQIIDSLVNKTVDIIAKVVGIDRANALWDAIAALKDKHITITTTYETNGAPPQNGYATGGSVFNRLASNYVSGGSGTKDDVPAMLTKGEYVHKVKSVAKYGRRFMEMVNHGVFPEGVARAFAGGGMALPRINAQGLLGGISNTIDTGSMPSTNANNVTNSNWSVNIGGNGLSPRGNVQSLSEQLINEVRKVY